LRISSVDPIAPWKVTPRALPVLIESEPVL
jgi:hypothetical protein